MQHFLTSRQMVDIPIKHLFVEYKFWIERERPFGSVTKELIALSRQREHFRRLLEPKRGDVVFSLATFLESFDIRTGYPLLLFLLDAELSEMQWQSISATLESYLLRRAVLGWTTKAYNRVFLSLAKALRATEPTAENLRTTLSGLTGESAGWPTDAEFSEAWLKGNAYDLKNPKVVHILRRVGEEHLTKLSEQITIESPLTVEHILPQSWLENWPLPSGERGLSGPEIWESKPDDPKVVASTRRNDLLQTFGNLTVLTQALNSSVSNSAWATKKPELMKASLLPINQQLHEYAAWDEETIQRRGKDLLEKALRLWSRPSS